ncbi:MAG: PspC domain-containing protein [Bacteroidetes bacterium]|jgi:phage shock protein PspC (stress-responsive transcriptional regulator)|nr:PspC domain-containing protein [Bacteroidota bacterium]
MKEVIQINIKGIVFHLDDDAHILLRTYLQEVQQHFRNVEYGQEIIDDFEMRVVELLKAKLTKNKEVINIQDVEEILNTLGKISDIEDQHSENTRERVKRKLYRDPENSTLGGVASGVAAYLGVDVVWIRLAFILAIFLNGLGIIAYLIMWIIVPNARTVTQRMEMRGEPVRFETIEENIRNEYENVKNNFSHISGSKTYQDSKNALAEIIRVVGNLILLIIKALAAIIGLSLIIAGSFLIIALLFSWVPFHFDVPWESWNYMPDVSDLLQRFIPSGMVMPFLLSVWIIVLIPILALIYGGIKLLFRLHMKDTAAGAFLFAAWILALLFAGSVVFMQYPNYQEERTEISTIDLNNWTGDTLYVASPYSNQYNHDISYIHFGDQYELIISPEQTDLTGNIEIDIYPAKTDYAQLKLIKQAMGENYYEAGENINHIIYTWNIDGPTLQVSPHFFLKPASYFRAQEMEIELFIPPGTLIYFDDSMYPIIDYARMDSGNYRHLTKRYWRMTNYGLQPADQIQQ